MGVNWSSLPSLLRLGQLSGTSWSLPSPNAPVGLKVRVTLWPGWMVPGSSAALKPRRTYLTHMGHDLEHEATNRSLPPGVELAYDGLRFEF